MSRQNAANGKRGRAYGVHELVADEAAAHLRADQLEGSRQVISRLVVVVLQLVQDLQKGIAQRILGKQKG